MCIRDRYMGKLILMMMNFPAAAFGVQHVKGKGHRKDTGSPNMLQQQPTQQTQLTQQGVKNKKQPPPMLWQGVSPQVPFGLIPPNLLGPAIPPPNSTRVSLQKAKSNQLPLANAGMVPTLPANFAATKPTAEIQQQQQQAVLAAKGAEAPKGQANTTARREFLTQENNKLREEIGRFETKIEETLRKLAEFRYTKLQQQH
eukprot:TRINITY_DN2048_c0_g1_i1.p1 TRINITY_DN2048_c0_g1~~TRINITY_DN2048_c0_g1_i1.p1  ORF type:complete len:200 (-),score=63.39 TRINITY_DN2048_c0_g1_i1:121-720(-)